MKVIKRFTVDGKEVKLLLEDDNKTVQVIFDNKVISVSEKDTWTNIKDEEWAQDGLLKIEVESYIKKERAKNKLEHIAKEVF